jgi:tRNA(fMet)-specific endonuclease VapC
MDAHLLDTNVISALYDQRRAEHRAVREAIAGLRPSTLQFVSVITIGELRFGLELSRHCGRKVEHIEQTIELAEQYRLAEVGIHTSRVYAEIKAASGAKYLNLKAKMPRWVDQWTDRVSTQRLQVDEIDLWIAAQSLERNYVVLTCDQDFGRVISPAVPALRIATVQLHTQAGPP